MYTSLKYLRILSVNHHDTEAQELCFSVLCFKHTTGKKKASKVRIMTRHSGIELAYLKVVTYPGLGILKLTVGAGKGKLIAVIA